MHFFTANLAAYKLLKRYVAIGDDGERLPVELDSFVLVATNSYRISSTD
jgi:hypothetical protein